jgi:hypothetical protein
MPVAQAVLSAQNLWSEEARRENGLFIHSEMVETSWMLYLRPAAVRSGYAGARSRTAATLGDIVQLAEQPGWVTKLALDILDGADPRRIARFADAMKNVPEQVRIDAAAAAHNAETERKQQDWLTRRNNQYR